jgi:hypothetical protein
MKAHIIVEEVWVVLNPDDTLAKVCATEQEASDYADGERGNAKYPPLRYGMAVVSYDLGMMKVAA